MDNPVQDNSVHDAMERWLKDVVIGMNLCPFASKPTSRGAVRVASTEAVTPEAIVSFLQQELEMLEDSSPVDLETTLVVLTEALWDFEQYTDFLMLVNAWLDDSGWADTFQVASFHPDYCFEGAEPEDVENYTNRAPYPVFHLLREQSLSDALAHYPNPESIPEKNMANLRRLTPKQLSELFPYL